MEAKQLKDIPNGEYFRRKADAKTTYTKEEYDRSYKRYQCANHNDIWGAGIQLKGTTIVYIGFDY